MKDLKTAFKYSLYFLVVVFFIFLFYYKSINNFFYSDDFEWLASAKRIICGKERLFLIHGRDFNPITKLYFIVNYKLFSLNPVGWRILQLLLLSVNSFLFFFFLKKSGIKEKISLAISISFLLSLFTSEVALNVSAISYVLAFLFFILAMNILEKSFFISLPIFFFSFLSKETIFFALIPIILLIKNRLKRKIYFAFIFFLVIFRFFIQMKSLSPYSSFISIKFIPEKFHISLLKSFQILPYNKPYFVSMLLFILIILSFFRLGKEKFFVFSFSGFILQLSFLLLFPKLSSRYFYFPTFFSLSIVAFYVNTIVLHKFKKSETLIALILLLTFITGSWYGIGKEINDYKLLGQFSKSTLYRAKNELKCKNLICKLENRSNKNLKLLYLKISKNGGLPKLLPVREHAYSGLIKYRDLFWLIKEGCIEKLLIEETKNMLYFYLDPNLAVWRR